MIRELGIQDLSNFVKVIQQGSGAIKIIGLTSNSQKVQKDFLFIAERGLTSDGHQYIEMAISRGASALLVENLEQVPKEFQGLVLQAPQTREIAPKIANLFYGHPSAELFCVGITGTNGKTSLTYLLEHLFNHAGRPTGVIGTINHHLGEKIWPTEMTTPHPIELQERLRQFCEGGAKTLAIEVSSHAIHQKRIEGIQFNVTIFTNLTRDHLDYHSSMEEYFDVKKTLFGSILEGSNKTPRYAIINKDDPWGAQIKAAAPIKTWTYGQKDADFTFHLKEMGFHGVTFNLQTPLGSFFVTSPLIGIHNIYNVMAALAASAAAGLPLEKSIEDLRSFSGIPGRLQSVPHSGQKTVLIDYAHSPDALENVLLALQKVRTDGHGRGRIICVFGCGGDRDKGKRPLMAQVAEKLADVIFVTSDNPRTEDPLQIINDIKVGFGASAAKKPIHFESDRARAIDEAIQGAQSEDVVLIAGKGHENYQIIGKEKFYFSDFEIARKSLT